LFPYDGETSAARFFYCSKASGEDRDHGNTHATVKPNDLMRYLIKLVAPKDAVILDPFMGSGSTGVAAIQMHNRFIGIELGPDHFEICKRRVNAAFDTFPLFNPKGNQ
jgi:site-specific DNA-methyltransferase (adenine-specific)